MASSLNLSLTQILIDQSRLYILFLSIIRFNVEKCGGALDVDPGTLKAYISLPLSSKDAFLKFLKKIDILFFNSALFNRNFYN